MECRRSKHLGTTKKTITQPIALGHSPSLPLHTETVLLHNRQTVEPDAGCQSNQEITDDSFQRTRDFRGHCVDMPGHDFRPPSLLTVSVPVSEIVKKKNVDSDSEKKLLLMPVRER